MVGSPAVKSPTFVSRLGCARELHPEDVGGKASVLHRILKRYPELPAKIPAGLVVRTSLLREVLGSSWQHLQSVLEEGTEVDIQTELKRTEETLSHTSLPGELMEDLESFASEHQGSKFAIRSSAIMEDSMANSCAGLFSSELNVPVEQLVDGIRKVWKSAFTPQVS